MRTPHNDQLSEPDRAGRRGQHVPERAVGTEQMLLPHHVRQTLRAQPISERPHRLRRDGTAGVGKGLRIEIEKVGHGYRYRPAAALPVEHPTA